jgi:hypothetical protein
MSSRTKILLGCTLLTSLVAGTFAFGIERSDRAGAFGSVDSAIIGQTAIHEPITRTLACAANDPVPNCLEHISIGVLAGHSGTFGAVGEPDDPLDGFPNPSARHCDNVDYGYGNPNPVSEAQKAFDECLDWFQSYMDFAVNSAAGLLNADGTIDAAATDLINALGGSYNACSFPDPKKGNTSNDSAKCNVLNGFGRALHVYEDVWSHSNWGDFADPKDPVGLYNPVGLGNTEQPSFMAYPGPRSLAIPEGFLTGCDDSVGISPCVVGSYENAEYSYKDRTGHSKVNKDNGVLDPNTCVASSPKSVRGKIIVDGVSNFSRATKGACGGARRAWSDLTTALINKYGAQRATAMIRAITLDHPLTLCAVSGSAAKADAPPVGDRPSSRTVTIDVVNRTSKTLACGQAVLDSGEWASYPPDTLTAGATARWRTQSNGMATGTEGRATFVLDGSASFTVHWNNPYWGSNSYSCTAPNGNDSTITVTFTGP